MAGQENPLPDTLFRALLDALPESIALIDAQGNILYVNAAWLAFGRQNAPNLALDWTEQNYLQACRMAEDEGEDDGRIAAEGIQAILHGDIPVFRHEYPCHSPGHKRWFLMQAMPLLWAGRTYCVISHHDITERKLAEERVEAMAYVDGLTGIANRRHFDGFLEQEWRRASRSGTPLALVMLDIDHFKPFNDHYGHQAGDDCLRRIGSALQDFAQRAGDLAARYGGEEFALVLANTELEPAARIAEEVRAAVLALGIPHAHSPVDRVLTVSLGVASMRPNKEAAPERLIKMADQALYAAKKAGRNRVATASPETSTGGTM
ncbi:MAG: sensor domain-containing diguanylate cyclase [Pseudomonadota bacterium]